MAVPVLILAVMTVVAARNAQLPEMAKGLLPVLPWGVAAMGAIMGWWFNRSRITFTLIAIVMVHGLLSTYFQTPPGRDAFGQVVFAAAAFLLPVNIAVFAFLEERGVLTLAGLVRAGAMAAQVGAVMIISGSGFSDLAGTVLHMRLLPPGFDQWTYLPQPAMFAFIGAFALLMARWVVMRSPLEAASAVAVAGSAIAIHGVAQGPAPDLFFFAAALILTVAVLQDAYRMAFHDELTGLPGRRALGDALKQLPARHAIAMLDIDHFKKFNDTHGHDAGDQVLQMIATHLEGTGGGGRAYRYGGEEFTLLFSGKDLDDAWEPLEDLCQAIAEARFVLRAKDRPQKKPKQAKTVAKPTVVNVTISIGVADFQDAETPDGVLREADKALYRAKKAGRDQVSN